MTDPISKPPAVVLSVFDRLLDDGAESRKSPEQYLREARQAVRRDLENLLNTRWRCRSAASHLSELDCSLVNYGVPDFSGPSLEQAVDPDLVFREIKKAIERWEPRLSNVRVESVKGRDSSDRVLRFRIEARLNLETLDEKVLFNSSLEMSTGNIQVGPRTG